MKYVSINSYIIRARKSNPIRIAKSPNDRYPIYANEIDIIGPARLVYDPNKQIMRCGAQLVIECMDVNVIR